MNNDLIDIAKAFPVVSDKIQQIIPFGSGHINDTYKLELESGTYVLQRINHHIFKDVPALTANIIKVTDFIARKIEASGSGMKIPRFYPVQDGRYFHRDASGNYWRLMSFIKDSRSYDLVPNDDIAYQGGKAYGWFVNSLSDFPATELAETIKNFHDIDFRLEIFSTAIKNNIAQRVETAEEEIAFVQKRAPEMRVILELGKAGKIPLRVTHNDTKINNVLFDAGNRPVSVIDLDTVMPGYVHYDFGDAIRTFTNTANEDEPDLSKVGINMAYFKAFAGGFLSETRQVLTPVEIEHLAFSAKLMTYIIGLRFLTDFLNGDTYFKTRYDTHNLVRARNQFRLLASMEKHFDEMQKVIANAR